MKTTNMKFSILTLQTRLKNFNFVIKKIIMRRCSRISGIWSSWTSSSSLTALPILGIFFSPVIQTQTWSLLCAFHDTPSKLTHHPIFTTAPGSQTFSYWGFCWVTKDVTLSQLQYWIEAMACSIITFPSKLILQNSNRSQ